MIHTLTCLQMRHLKILINGSVSTPPATGNGSLYSVNSRARHPFNNSPDHYVSYDITYPVFRDFKDTGMEDILNDYFMDMTAKAQDMALETRASVGLEKVVYTSSFDANFTTDCDANGILSLRINQYWYEGGVHGFFRRTSSLVDFNNARVYQSYPECLAGHGL